MSNFTRRSNDWRIIIKLVNRLTIVLTCHICPSWACKGAHQPTILLPYVRSLFIENFYLFCAAKRRQLSLWSEILHSYIRVLCTSYNIIIIISVQHRRRAVGNKMRRQSMEYIYIFFFFLLHEPAREISRYVRAMICFFFLLPSRFKETFDLRTVPAYQRLLRYASFSMYM